MILNLYISFGGVWDLASHPSELGIQLSPPISTGNAYAKHVSEYECATASEVPGMNGLLPGAALLLDTHSPDRSGLEQIPQAFGNHHNISWWSGWRTYFHSFPYIWLISRLERRSRQIENGEERRSKYFNYFSAAVMGNYSKNLFVRSANIARKGRGESWMTPGRMQLWSWAPLTTS